MTSKAEGTRKSWLDPKVRHQRSVNISKAQQARAHEMSQIVKKLWEDPEFRKKIQHEPHNKISEAQKPRIICLKCKKEFPILPCRIGTKKFCKKECSDAYKRGRPNTKNRGRIPSCRVGYGVSGRYKKQLFRSLYELSFIVNVLEANNINVEYETLRIPLGNGHVYIPDFISHELKTVYEIKYEAALTQTKNITKLSMGRLFVEQMGYTFEIYTEKRMSVLTTKEIIALALNGTIALHKKKNGGKIYQQIMKALELQRCRSSPTVRS